MQLTSHSQFADISIKATGGFTGDVSYFSVREIGMVKGNYVFTPSYEHPDTLYYQCGAHDDMGAKISLINSPGAILNDLELTGSPLSFRSCIS